MGAAKKVGGGLAAAAAVGAGLFAALAPQDCPRSSACINWKPVTTYECTPIPPATTCIGEPITLPVTYSVYRGDAANAINTLVGTTTALELVMPNPTKETRTFYFAVTAKVALSESKKSNSASKLVRAPGPTDGRIEGPTDGGIED